MSEFSTEQSIINITNNNDDQNENIFLSQSGSLYKDFNLNLFKVCEQKVQLDIDLYKQTITGITELWVVPDDKINFINEIQLDCGNEINVLQVQLVIKKDNEEANINDDVEEVLDLDYVHYNPTHENDFEMDLNNFEQNILFTGGNSIEELNYLKNKKYEPKFDPFTKNKDVSDPKLYINMAPFNHKFKPPTKKHFSGNADASTANNYMTPLVINPSTNKSINTPVTLLEKDNNLQPFTIRISYYIECPKNEGINFLQNNSEVPISTCHTTNNLLNYSASNWVPCIDSVNEKCLWEIEVVTLRDLYSHITENPELKEKLDKFANEEISVITGDITTQNEIFLSDTNKRTVFTLLNPVSASGVGFSIGFFKNYAFGNSVGDLPVNVWVPQNFKILNDKGPQCDIKLLNINEPDIRDEVNIDMDDFAIEEELIYNSFLTMPKTLEFFNNYFGTFPFNSLNVVILHDLYVESLSFQGLCFLNYDKFVYSANELDPLLENSIKLADVLSVQWFGINISPNSMDEFWIIFGIQGFMRLKFINEVLGNNEYQYRLKLYNDYIVQNSYNKPSLVKFYNYLNYPVKLDSHDNHLIEFIRVKSMMVLFILDCKMTKMERSLGIYKIINKLNILSVSGDLENNCISNDFFQHQVEKTYKGKLNQFFKQWVHNIGVPKFEINQKFNKKKMVVELIIKQVFEESGEDSQKLLVSRLPDLYNIPQKHQIYQGNLTIRIHEADGIPYEHNIHISEETTRLDIQYNSKYKKLKRGEHKGLGDILVTPTELNAWNITPMITFTNNTVSGTNAGVIASTADEDLIESGTEAYEWIRIDSDFEWIGKIVSFNMKFEMYVSQLQLDKDVVAQIQSIEYLENLVISQENFRSVQEMDLQVSSCLIRCILDERYFYGVRLRAIDALSFYHIKKGFNGGFNHLILIVENLLFDEGGNLKYNHFGNFTNYKIIKALIENLSTAVVSEDEIDELENNEILNKIKVLSQKLLLFNDNSKNQFNDDNYLILLINNLVKLIIKFPEDREFRRSSFKIITKFERLEKWSRIKSTKLLHCIYWSKLLLLNEGLNDGLFEIYDFVDEIYKITLNAKENNDNSMILFAFNVLIIVGIKNKDILKYFFVKMVIVHQNNPYLRNNLIDAFIDAIKFVVLKSNKISINAYNEDFESLQKIYNPNLFNDLNKFRTFSDFEKYDEPVPNTTSGLHNAHTNSEIVLGAATNDESSRKNVFLDSEMEIKLQRDLALRNKGNQKYLLEYSRSLFATFDPLKQILWFLLNKKSLLIDAQKAKLFEFLPIIYAQQKKFYVTLRLPSERKLIMRRSDITYNEKGSCEKFEMKVVIQKESRFIKPKPVMKFSLNNSQFKIKKVKLKAGRKAKQLQQESVTLPIKLQTPVILPDIYYKAETKRFGSLPATNVKISSSKKRIIISSLPEGNDMISFPKMNKNKLIVKIKTKK